MEKLLQLVSGCMQDPVAIDADTPLLSSGLIDSLGVVVLLTEIEAGFGVIIEPEEVDVASFDTPRQIWDRLSMHDGIRRPV
jgi:acyl carrier protein